MMVGKAMVVRAASSVALTRMKRKRNAGTQLGFSFSPFYLDWGPRPRDDSSHTQGMLCSFS